MRATVKWFIPQKGYGFLTTDEGEEIFVHQTNIIMDGFRLLNEDEIVDFEIGTGTNGKEQAINVKPILTLKMIKDVLRKDNLYVKTSKVGGLRHYLVTDVNNVIQSSEDGMWFEELTAYAGFDVNALE